MRVCDFGVVVVVFYFFELVSVLWKDLRWELKCLHNICHILAASSYSIEKMSQLLDADRQTDRQAYRQKQTFALICKMTIFAFHFAHLSLLLIRFYRIVFSLFHLFSFMFIAFGATTTKNMKTKKKKQKQNTRKRKASMACIHLAKGARQKWNGTHKPAIQSVLSFMIHLLHPYPIEEWRII